MQVEFAFEIGQYVMLKTPICARAIEVGYRHYSFSMRTPPQLVLCVCGRMLEEGPGVAAKRYRCRVLPMLSLPTNMVTTGTLSIIDFDEYELEIYNPAEQEAKLNMWSSEDQRKLEANEQEAERELEERSRQVKAVKR